MTIAELTDACTRAIKNKSDREAAGLPTFGKAMIQLVIPGPATGFKRRLAGRRGPLGDIMCENVIDGKVCCVVNFDAKGSLEWIRKQEPAHV